MSLKKFKVGSNMYSWTTHGHCHLGGECSHKCSYCYVDNPRFGRAEKFTGHIRLLEDEFSVKYGNGKTIFMEYQNDLFAKEVPDEFISRIINHACQFTGNTYVFQTKNPMRYKGFLHVIPAGSILGSTLETNRDMSAISKAPPAIERYEGMKSLPSTFKRFLTLEPILDFDVDILAKWIGDIKPDFINLGADSKSHNLPEPTVEKIMALVEKLKIYGVELREKHNLQRLMPK